MLAASDHVATVAEEEPDEAEPGLEAEALDNGSEAAGDPQTDTGVREEAHVRLEGRSGHGFVQHRFTELDILVLKLERGEATYEEIQMLSELMGESVGVGMSDPSLGVARVGKVELVSRRVDRDGKVKTKLRVGELRCNKCMVRYKDHLIMRDNETLSDDIFVTSEMMRVSRSVCLSFGSKRMWACWYVIICE